MCVAEDDAPGTAKKQPQGRHSNAITSSTVAFGINNSGDITGRYSKPGGTFGFILSNGVFHNVHIPAGSTLGVYDVEDNGLSLVGDAVLKSDSSYHAFVAS
jgi:hypothetical protein